MFGYTFGFRTLTPSGVRLVHGLMFLLAACATWYMRSPQMQDVLEEAPDMYPTNCGGTFNNSCIGTFGAMRLALGTVIYQVVMMLLTINSSRRGDCPGQIHNSWWLLKPLVMGGIVFGCFLIDVEHVARFYWPAFVGACVYTLWHALVLVRGSFAWMNVWRGKSDAPLYVIGLVFAIVAFVGGIAALTVLMFIAFTPSGCGLNIFFIVFNICIFVAMLIFAWILAARGTTERMMLLPVCLGMLFATYLVWSAVTSQPQSTGHDCIALYSTVEAAQKLGIYFGMGLFLLAIAWRITRADERGDGGDHDAKHRWHQFYYTDEEEDEASDEEPTYSYPLFHLELALGACYACMVVTAWNEVRERDGAYVLAQSWPAVWVKMSLSWAAAAVLALVALRPSLRGQ